MSNCCTSFRGHPSRLRLPSKRYQCRERIVDHSVDDDAFDHLALVAFECFVTKIKIGIDDSSTFDASSLVFYCREPSCGVLVDDECAAQKPDDGAMDPSFFDPGYTLAGKTGFQIWPGSRLVVEALTVPQQSIDTDKLRHWQERIASSSVSLRVLEVGAGVGMVGISLASAGAQVLLTDLTTLVTESLVPNLERNSTASGDEMQHPPGWMTDYLPSIHHDDIDSTQNIVRQIGPGWAATAALDWTQPLEDQLSEEQLQVDLIVASDCVWLSSMLQALISTVEAVFKVSKRSPKLLMSFQRRDPDKLESTTSNMFTTVDGIINELQARKWAVDCLAWHPVAYNEGGKQNLSKEVFLLEISP